MEGCDCTRKTNEKSTAIQPINRSLSSGYGRSQGTVRWSGKQPNSWKVCPNSNYCFWIGNGSQGTSKFIHKGNETEQRGRIMTGSPQLCPYSYSVTNKILTRASSFLDRYLLVYQKECQISQGRDCMHGPSVSFYQSKQRAVPNCVFQAQMHPRFRSHY